MDIVEVLRKDTGYFSSQNNAYIYLQSKYKVTVIRIDQSQKYVHRPYYDKFDVDIFLQLWVLVQLIVPAQLNKPILHRRSYGQAVV